MYVPRYNLHLTLYILLVSSSFSLWSTSKDFFPVSKIKWLHLPNFYFFLGVPFLMNSLKSLKKLADFGTYSIKECYCLVPFFCPSCEGKEKGHTLGVCLGLKQISAKVERVRITDYSVLHTNFTRSAFDSHKQQLWSFGFVHPMASIDSCGI